MEIGLRIFYLLFLIQKQTPREARTRQSTEMTMESEARKPRPLRTPASPSLFMAGFPKALRVVNWYSWVLQPACVCAGSSQGMSVSITIVVLPLISSTLPPPQ